MVQKHSGKAANSKSAPVLAYADAFHAAARRGNLTKIKSIIAELRALLPAADSKDGHSPCVPLIEHKIGEQELTPLLEAVVNGQPEIVEYLCGELGADVEAMGQLGSTALLYAAEVGDFGIVCYLVERAHADIWAREAELGALAVHLAAEFGHLSIVEYLIDMEPDFLEVKTVQGDTPLCRAAVGGHLEIVQYLVEVKMANTEARGFEGRTPLLKAAAEGHAAVVRYLANNARANLDARDSSAYESQAIHLACEFGHLAVARVLLELKPELIHTTMAKNNETPLEIARRTKHSPITTELEKQLDFTALERGSNSSKEGESSDETDNAGNRSSSGWFSSLSFGLWNRK